MNIILQPDQESLRAFGVLAHVDAAERKRIYALPAGKFQHAIKTLENMVDVSKKHAARRVENQAMGEARGGTRF